MTTKRTRNKELRYPRTCPVCGTTREYMRPLDKRRSGLCKPCQTKASHVKGRRFPKDDVDNAVLIQEYKAGASLPELAQKYGMTPRGIKLKIERAGGETRKVGAEETRKLMSAKSQGVPPDDWQEFRTPYWTRIMGSADYQNWRKAVFERDGFTCQQCGDKTGGNLNAHHILRKALYPHLVFETRNGITLCENCHDKTFHHEEKFVDHFFALLGIERLE